MATITTLGEFIGQVIEIVFDPSKAQTSDYVRVKLKFDVSKPVRRSKVINFPRESEVTIWYDFERIQKRCFECQRLIHECEKCPVFLKKQQESFSGRKINDTIEKPKLPVVIKESDPLFGILSEEQVGMNPATWVFRIAPEVLQEMRRYLLAGEGSDKRIREERVKCSIADLENDPLGQKTMLRLEPPPLITSNIDKGKGIIFDFQSSGENEKVKTWNKATNMFLLMLEKKSFSDGVEGNNATNMFLFRLVQRFIGMVSLKPPLPGQV